MSFTSAADIASGFKRRVSGSSNSTSNKRGDLSLRIPSQSVEFTGFGQGLHAGAVTGNPPSPLYLAESGTVGCYVIT